MLLLLELIVLSGTNCSKLETLHTVLLLLTCFAAAFLREMLSIIISFVSNLIVNVLYSTCFYFEASITHTN